MKWPEIVRLPLIIILNLFSQGIMIRIICCGMLGILYFDKQYEKMLPVLQSVLREKPEDFVAKRLYAYCLSKRENGKNVWKQ